MFLSWNKLSMFVNMCFLKVKYHLQTPISTVLNPSPVKWMQEINWEKILVHAKKRWTTHRWLANYHVNARHLKKLKFSISRNSQISNRLLYVRDSNIQADAAMTFSPLLDFVETGNLAAWVQNKYLQATGSSI